jgi:hypothetical protein
LPGPGTGAHDITVRAEDAHREAYTTITRQQVEFPGILDAYAAVERWIDDAGREMTGAPREVYFVDGEARPTTRSATSPSRSPRRSSMRPLT